MGKGGKNIMPGRRNHMCQEKEVRTLFQVKKPHVPRSCSGRHHGAKEELKEGQGNKESKEEYGSRGG